ncbi:hypothetical protein C8J57DRAFT_1396936 [Mycena rebaudengoi]|nr:hypothetical protein C8J57DRAFT_1396936 [Mycena rebaudengoi]
MPATKLTIDDISPLIQYSPAEAWKAGDQKDPFAKQYSNGGTFMVSSTKDSSATFHFTGTQVSIFGGMRNNHGPYTVKLDDKTSTFDGFSEKEQFKALLDSGTLKEGPHTVVITNTFKDKTAAFLDIDYVTITWLTDPSATEATDTLEDSSSQFSYTPSKSWSTDLPKSYSNFKDNSGHVTTDKDASAVLAFSGETVTLYGAVGPDLGQYEVKMDGQSSGTFVATRENYAAQVQLFYADNLGSGNHTLEVVNKPTSKQKNLAIDFAMVAPPSSSSISGSPSSTPSPTSSGSPNGGHKPMSSIELALIIVGVIAAISLAFTIFGLTVRQANKRKLRREPKVASADVEAFTNAISMKSMTPHPESETAHLLGSQGRSTQ